MGVAKVTLNGDTLIDITSSTVTADKMISPTKAYNKAGDATTGTIASKTSSDITVSGATVTVPAGSYSSSTSKTVASGSAGTPTASKGSVSNHSVTVTPSVTNTTGYITGSTKTGTGVTVTASELASGNKSITANGSNIDVVGYSTVSVSVPGDALAVTLSYNSTSHMWEPNKTYAQIRDAYSAGQTVVVDTDVGGDNAPAEGEWLSGTVGTFYYIVHEYKNGLYHGVTRSQIIEYHYNMGPSGISIEDESIYPMPTGTISITSYGGTTDVDAYEYATVPAPTLQTKSVSPTESAQTITADTGYDWLEEVDVEAIPLTYVGSGITRRSASDLTASGRTVSVPDGYYQRAVTKSISLGTAGTPSATVGTVSNHSVTVTPSVTNSEGYISSGTKTGTAVTISASDLASGNKAITANGTGIDVVGYSTVSVAVPAAVPTLQTKSVTPTESAQTITADSGYDGLDEVDVEAISSTYVGSGITRRDSDDITVLARTVNVPGGYYQRQATKTIAAGLAGTPTATKGAVSNHSVSVTPSVINTTGYITGSTKTGTAVTVTASELASGNKEITTNGTGIDVVGYSTVSVAVPTGTINNQNKTVSPSTSQQTITADSGYTGLGTVTVNAMPTQTLPTSASTTHTGTRKSLILPNTSTRYINIPTGYNSSNAYYEIVSSGQFTATVVGTSPNPDDNYVEYGSTSYYQNGQTFKFNGGESVDIFAYSGSGSVYIDGGNKSTQEYTYKLPNANITITFPSNSDDVRITVAASTELSCEQGTFTPTADISHPSIPFAGTHSETPLYACVFDTSSYTLDTTDSIDTFIYADAYKMNGSTFPFNSNNRYVLVTATFKTSTSASGYNGAKNYSSDVLDDSSSNYPRWYCDNVAIKPYANSDTRYFRAGHTYKWMAVWK